MSCVVGLLQNGKLYLGADGFATTEGGERRPIICNKIFTNNSYLIGFTGSVRHGQILGPKHFKPPESIYDFADAVREIFAEKGAMLTSEVGQQIHASNLLLGYHGRLYEVLIDFQLNEVFGSYTAIGSGSPYAMGSLYATKKWNSAEKRIMNALKAATEFDTSCGLPYQIEVME